MGVSNQNLARSDTGRLGRLAHFIARHRWPVIGVWVVRRSLSISLTREQVSLMAIGGSATALRGCDGSSASIGGPPAPVQSVHSPRVSARARQ